MAPIILSIKKRSEFLDVRNSNFCIIGKHLIINYKSNKHAKTFRIGLTVSKKIGKAVVRNYIKRIIRSAVIKNYDLIPLKYDFEIIPKKNFHNIKFHSLEKDLLSIIKKIE